MYMQGLVGGGGVRVGSVRGGSGGETGGRAEREVPRVRGGLGGQIGGVGLAGAVGGWVDGARFVVGVWRV